MSIPSESNKDSKRHGRFYRHKLTQACDNCRAKRIKCDGQYPRCSPCNLKELNCTYLLTTKRRGPKSQKVEQLEKRLAELEEELALRPKVEKDNRRNPSPPKGDLLVLDNELGDNLEPDYTLPSREVIYELIRLFFSITHPTIRFVHKPTLDSRLGSENKPYLLLNAIFALSARFSTHPQVVLAGRPRYLNGDVFAQRLLSLLSPTLLAQPTLDTVQALILLGLHEYGKMEGFSSWSYIGIAIRLAQQLGLHMIDSYHNKDTFIHRPGTEDWLMTECKRRTWWGCFIADRFASSLVGRSTSIDLRDCLVQLPSGDAQWDRRFGVISQLAPITAEELADFGTDISGSRSVFCNLSAHFIALVDLSGKVTSYLMHRAARSGPHDPEYSELMDLDHQIANWLSDLPSRFHWPQDFLRLNPSMSIEGQEDIGSDIFRAVACMFTMYHGTVIALHRGNLAHAQRDPGGQAMIDLSKGRCISAANAIAQLVEDAWHRIDDMGDPFYPYAIFNAATIHANYIYLESQLPPQAQLARQHLSTCTEALHHLSKIWLMSKTYLVMLQTLITTLSLDQDNPSNCTIQHPGTTPFPSPQPENQTDAYVPGMWEVFSISYFDWFYTFAPDKAQEVVKRNDK